MWAITSPLTKQTGVPFVLHSRALKAAGIDLQERLAEKGEQATPAQVLQGFKTAAPLKLVERDGVLRITAEPKK